MIDKKDTKDKKKKAKIPLKKRNKKTNVSRSVKVGTKKVADIETGLVSEVNQFEITDVDFNFNKIWLGHLLDTLDIIGNKKIQIMNYLLENRNPTNNEIYVTQRIVSDQLKCALQTVSDTFNLLQTSNTLIKLRNGVYQLNPDVIWCGNNNSRMDILLSYKKISEIEDKSNKEIGDSNE